MTVPGFIRVILRSFIDFFRDGGLMLAGSMSYFFMMALIPFGLFLVTLFGYFIGEDIEFYHFFLSKLINFFPKITSGITENLKSIIIFKGIGKFSLILYGLLSFQLFSSVESSLNVIFKTKERRSFIVSLILSLLLVTIIMAFLLISFGATTTISLLKTLKESFPGLKIGALTGFLIGFIVPVILVFFTAATIYFLFPLKAVKVRHAACGALFTAVLLEAAKHVFTIYVVKVAKLGTIYGPLSAFVIFLLWIFYSSCIFLVGAELVYNLGKTKEG